MRDQVAAGGDDVGVALARRWKGAKKRREATQADLDDYGALKSGRRVRMMRNADRHIGL